MNERVFRYYVRKVTKRVPINRYGKLGFREYIQAVLTDDITDFNYRKRIKFTPADNDQILDIIKRNMCNVCNMIDERMVDDYA